MSGIRGLKRKLPDTGVKLKKRKINGQVNKLKFRNDRNMSLVDMWKTPIDIVSGSLKEKVPEEMKLEDDLISPECEERITTVETLNFSKSPKKAKVDIDVEEAKVVKLKLEKNSSKETAENSPKKHTEDLKKSGLSKYFEIPAKNKSKPVDDENCKHQDCLQLLENLKLGFVNSVEWKNIRKQDLELNYAIILKKDTADQIFQQLEAETEYYSGDLAKIRIYGKWLNIPRKQVAYGDNGITYKFSGNCLPARPWTPLLSIVKNEIEKLTGFSYNFVLINRYKNGEDHIGEHRDDEKDLVPQYPIASLSLGQQRDFLLRHALARKKPTSGQHPPAVTVPLEHGSLLIMKAPTNDHWYHSLPVRKRAFHPRINLTFRRMVVK